MPELSALPWAQKGGIASSGAGGSPVPLPVALVSAPTPAGAGITVPIHKRLYEACTVTTSSKIIGGRGTLLPFPHSGPLPRPHADVKGPISAFVHLA